MRATLLTFHVIHIGRDLIPPFIVSRLGSRLPLGQSWRCSNATYILWNWLQPFLTTSVSGGKVQIIAIFEEDRGAQLTLSLSPLLPRPSTTSWPSTTAASLPNHRICTNRIALPVQASFFGEIIKDDIPTVSQQLWYVGKMT